MTYGPVEAIFQQQRVSSTNTVSLQDFDEGAEAEEE
jgi:hypothetical protein